MPLQGPKRKKQTNSSMHRAPIMNCIEAPKESQVNTFWHLLLLFVFFLSPCFPSENTKKKTRVSRLGKSVMQLLKRDKLRNGQGRKPSLEVACPEVTCPEAASVYGAVGIRLFNCANRSFYFWIYFLRKKTVTQAKRSQPASALSSLAD